MVSVNDTNRTDLVIPVAYTDQRLMVLDKPAGVVVNRAENVFEPTIQDYVESRYPALFARLQDDESGTPLRETFKKRSGIAHRLDKETSGVLVVAKDPVSLGVMMAKFKQRLVKKSYLALVHGKLEAPRGSIGLPIKRSRVDRQQFTVDPEGKEAISWYRVVREYRDPEGRVYSLVKVWPKTGRTHQIRVHLKAIGHPLVGDTVYASRKQYHLDRQSLDRHFLHADQLTVPDFFGRTVKVAVALPQALQRFLAGLVTQE